MKAVEIFFRLLFALIGLGLLPVGWLHYEHQWQLQKLLQELDQSLKIDTLLKRWGQLDSIPSPLARAHQDYYYFRFLVELDESEKAMKLGLMLQRSFPGYYDLEQWLSVLELQNRNFKGSLFWVEKAIDYHPLDESNYFQKSLILKRMGLEKEAKRAQEEGLKIGRRNLTFRNN